MVLFVQLNAERFLRGTALFFNCNSGWFSPSRLCYGWGD